MPSQRPGPIPGQQPPPQPPHLQLVFRVRWYHFVTVPLVFVSLLIGGFFIFLMALGGLAVAIRSLEEPAHGARVAAEAWWYGAEAKHCYRLDLSAFDAKLAAHHRAVDEVQQAMDWLRDGAPPPLLVRLAEERRDALARGTMWYSRSEALRPLGLTCHAMREHVLPALRTCYGAGLVAEFDWCEDDDDPGWWHVTAQYTGSPGPCHAAEHVDVQWTARERQRMLTGPAVACPQS